MPLTPDEEFLAADWCRRVRESQLAHYECAKLYGRFNSLLGIPTIVLTVTVGTTVFANINQHADERTKVLLGLLSMAAAVLASLQTFLAFADRSARHRVTGAKYGSIRRDLELLKTSPPANEYEVKLELTRIKKKMDSLAQGSPAVPTNLKARVDEKLKSHEHPRVFDKRASS